MSGTNVYISAGPSGISSAYRPIIFKIQSPTSTPELQVRGEIFARNDVAGAFSFVASKYEKKYLGNEYFIFDFSNILQGLLSFDRQESAPVSMGNVTPCPNSIVEFKVKFTEVYYDGNGLPADFTYVWSSVYRAVNAVPQHEEDQTLSDYIIQGSEGDSFSSGFSNEFKSA
jgi:hypothetical protein